MTTLSLAIQSTPRKSMQQNRHDTQTMNHRPIDKTRIACHLFGTSSCTLENRQRATACRRFIVHSLAYTLANELGGHSPPDSTSATSSLRIQTDDLGLEDHRLQIYPTSWADGHIVTVDTDATATERAIDDDVGRTARSDAGGAEPPPASFFIANIYTVNLGIPCRHALPFLIVFKISFRFLYI